MSLPVNNLNQERPPLSPQIDNFDRIDPPSPPKSPAASDFDDEDSRLDQNGPPPPDSDEDDPPPPDSDEDDPPLPDFEEEDLPVTREDMRTNLEFIQMLEDATLESRFSPAELEAFCNPQEISFSPSEDPDLLLSISNFVANLNASQDIYTKNRSNFQRRCPEVKMLLFDQVRRSVSDLSGVLTWQDDMCVDSCVGFTGPYARLEDCPKCHKPCYDQEKLEKSNGKTKVPQKSFTTFPIGPQLQSRWKSPGMAQKMHYRRNKTKDLL